MRAIASFNRRATPIDTFEGIYCYVNQDTCLLRGTKGLQFVHNRSYTSLGSRTRPRQINTRYSTSIHNGHHESPAQSLIHSVSRLAIRNRRYSSASPYVKSSVTQDEIQHSSERKWVTEEVELPIGGNGSITLDISRAYHHVDSEETSSQRTKDMLMYLPPGPSLQKTLPELNATGEGLLNSVRKHTLLDHLDKTVGISTVVQINYRLSSSTGRGPSTVDHRFPNPIHDVAIAFDWILENLREGLEESQRPWNNGQVPRTYVAGSNFGGSLALMLALTQPNDIHALAIHDPMVDWVGLDELAVTAKISTALSSSSSTSKRRTQSESEEHKVKTREAAQALIQLRTALFRNPSGFFDPFASPLLFLRAPGRDTPTWRTARPESEEAVADKEDVIEAMKLDGGVQIDDREVAEIVSERGYGPYDDDWHTVESEFDPDEGRTAVSDLQSVQQITTNLSKVQLSENSIADPEHLQPHLVSDVQPFTDLSPAPQHDDHEAVSSETHQPLVDASSPITEVPKLTPPRRRKVLRRWPPVGRPEDVDLPFVRIYSTVPTSSFPPHPPSTNQQSDPSVVDFAYVLNTQARDMVEVMKRACFWGRDRSVGEARVTLQQIDRDGREVDNVVGRAGAGGDGEVGRSRDEVIGGGDWTVDAIKWLHKKGRVEKWQ